MSLRAPTVVVFEYKGYSDESFVDFIEDVWQRWFSHDTSNVHIFVDTEAQTGYSSAFRTRIMRWSKQIAARTETYFLLVKSRWVAMGIEIVRASVGLPGAHSEVTTRREHFRARLEDAARRSSAAASVS